MATVLIAEDDQDIRDTLREVLEDEGYSVAVARDGAEALDAIRASPPTLVILDLMMPVLSGAEVLAHLKADAALRSIPVIVVSATERARIEKTVRDAGAEGWLQKPIALADLLAAVQRHCA